MISSTKDLLGDPPVEPAVKPRTLWYLPTNQLNLMFMLAAGLISGPKGIGRKYYSDALSVFPGWLPLFAEAIPGAVFEHSVSEGEHLFPLVAQLDLSALRGPVAVPDHQGDLCERRFPGELTGEEPVMWVPAPLPSAWIRVILFASRADKVAADEQAADYANVDLKPFKRQLRAKLFKPTPLLDWPPRQGALPDRDRPMHRVAALGGAMAVLLAIGNRGDVATTASRLAFDPLDPLNHLKMGPDSSGDPMLSALQHWLAMTPLPAAEGLQTTMLFRTLEAIVEEKNRCDSGEHSAAGQMDTRQAVLDYLDREKAGIGDDRLQAALEKLSNDLRGIIGFGSDTATELFERHGKPYSRALILFFLHADCDEFVAYRHPLLREMDIIVAATLFAAGAGWMGVADELRGVPGLAAAATERMAAAAQRGGQTGIELGTPPPRNRCLRELLLPAKQEWNKRQQQVALELARGLGWSDLIHTRISLGKGDYRLCVDGSGAHILLDGEPKGVVTEVEREGLRRMLAEASIPPKLDARVRAVLKV